VIPLPPTTEAGSRRALVAAISCIAAFGAGMGFSMPLLALVLETRGIDSSVIGLNAAMTFLGVILATPAVPWAAQVLGAKPLMLGYLGAGLICFALMMLSDNLSLRFLLRFGTGVAGPGLHRVGGVYRQPCRRSRPRPNYSKLRRGSIRHSRRRAAAAARHRDCRVAADHR
jgi:predicted MFS family arabinose efflux permease